MRAQSELVSQGYCYGDIDIFRVDVALRVRFENRTDKELILDREIGQAS